MARLTLILLFLGALAVPAAQAEPDPTPSPTLTGEEAEATAPARPSRIRVAVAGSEPFVFRHEAEPGGISVEVWRKAAEQLQLDSEYRLYRSADEVIEAVVTGQADVAVGPLSITRRRAERVNFTQPWMHAGIGILTQPSVGLWGFFAQLMSRAFLVGVGGLLAILTAVGGLLWAVERRENEAFGGSAVTGIGNGMWLALVTMTTVGYGDLAPVTRLGRVIAGAWMIIAMITASSLTAGIATVLTLSQLTTGSVQSPTDFPGRPIGVVEGTATSSFVHRNGGHSVPFPTLALAVQALEDGKVDAVAHDRPMLAYLLHNDPSRGLVLSDLAWESQGYGFAFPLDAPLRHEVNIELLGLNETGAVQRMLDRWL